MNEQILERMKAMKLFGMVQAFSGTLATTNL